MTKPSGASLGMKEKKKEENGITLTNPSWGCVNPRTTLPQLLLGFYVPSDRMAVVYFKILFGQGYTINIYRLNNS